MLDYGIVSNEIDIVSIEEEIIQLGLKYSLVIVYIFFVVVDSNFVVGVLGGGGDDDIGGGVIEIDELEVYFNEQFI